jgi:hypothetical protein
MAEVSIKTVADFFKIGDGTTNSETGDPRNSLTAFSKEWKALTDEDKAEIKVGVADALGG